jgi:hypothetical protein
MAILDDECVLGKFVDKFYNFGYRGSLALIALVLFLLFTIFFVVIDPMFRGATDPSLMDLQLTCSAQRFHEIIVSWSKSVNNSADIYKLATILLDYIYPIIYSVMLAFGYAAVRGNNKPGRLDRLVFLLPFAAAFFDYCENTFHILMLRNVHNLATAFANYYSNLPVALSFICSVLKFLFFYAGILAFLGAVIYRIKKRLA